MPPRRRSSPLSLDNLETLSGPELLEGQASLESSPTSLQKPTCMTTTELMRTQAHSLIRLIFEAENLRLKQVLTKRPQTERRNKPS